MQVKSQRDGARTGGLVLRLAHPSKRTTEFRVALNGRKRGKEHINKVAHYEWITCGSLIEASGFCVCVCVWKCCVKLTFGGLDELLD